MKKWGILFAFLFLISFVSADIVSVNSGGDNGMIINPDTYIEGFFSCVPKTCSYFGYNCDSWGDGCEGTLNCGTCSSGYTCTLGICTAVLVTPPVTPPGAPGEGGSIEEGLIVYPTVIELTILNATVKDQTITIINSGTSTKTITISQTGLNNMILFNNTPLILAPGETKYLFVKFVAPNEAGKIYVGKILIGGKEILVSLDVVSEYLLFDSNIAVLNKDYLVGKNEELKTKVTLIPLGDKKRMDVFLNYTIRDYDGKVYITQSESMLVDRQIDFRKNFDIGLLPLGDYVVGLELVYPGGIAPSSAHFTIVEQSPSGFFGKLAFWLIIIILLVLIMIIILMIKKRRDREKGV